MNLSPSAQEERVSSEHAPQCRCVVCGCESVGKSQLLASLTGRLPVSENFRGSTICCETYHDGEVSWTDTPGIVRESETSATRSALDEIASADRVMLVARADRAADELPPMLSTTAGKLGFVALTFSDRIPSEVSLETEKLAATLGVPVFPIDARHLKHDEAAAIRNAAMAPSGEISRFPSAPPKHLPVPVSERTRRPSLAMRFLAHPLVALLLLFLPAVLCVAYANRFADALYDPIAGLLTPVMEEIVTWPGVLAALFGGDYGLVAMLPFLVLYAAPTIIVFSAILAVYKSSGLIDRLSYSLYPWLRPFGIGGRDLVRVVMGFGCNVPAIVSSRACHGCSRGACVSAISFGSACSYQLPATLAVFGAAGMAGLGLVYLAVLAATTLIYLRFTTPKVLRAATNKIVVQPPNALTPPRSSSVWREVVGNLRQFVVMAFPIFVAICLVAAFLDWAGAFDLLARGLAPVLGLFNLPADSASAVVLGAIRKDGIAIGLLDGGTGALKVALATPAQVLTAVYLAGVLLPCLVTVFTIAREMGWKYAIKLCARQMVWAAGFAIVIAWGGAIIF